MYVSLKYLLILGAGVMSLSCNLEKSQEPSPIDRGTYGLEATPNSVRSYGGGGGVFVLSMTPSEDFEGGIVLSLIAHPSLGAELFDGSLSSEDRVTEVTVRPDTNATVGTSPILVVATHAQVSDTLTLDVQIVQGYELPREYAAAVWDEFVPWLQAEHPELGIEAEQDWFGYTARPGLFGSGSWTLLNSSWELTIKWAVRPSAVTYLLLMRERGEAEPTFAAKREPEGIIHQIPVDECNFWPSAPE